MPTRKRFAKPSKRSSGGFSEMTSRGKRLLAGLNQVKAHLEGKIVLPPEIPVALDIQSIRKKTGLSQSAFATRFAIGLRTLQDWEQGRRAPDATVRAYLTVIERAPDVVSRVLAGRS